MNSKAEKYNKFLDENEIRCFQFVDTGDQMNSVVYQSVMDINGNNLPVMLVIDDSIFVMLHVRLANSVVNDGNKAALLDYLNALNEQYKVFKYYVNNGGDIIIESCLPCSPDSFEPQMIHLVVDVIIKHLQEEYSKIMKLVWMPDMIKDKE